MTYFKTFGFGLIAALIMGLLLSFTDGNLASTGKSIQYDFDEITLTTSSSLDTAIFSLGAHYTPLNYEVQITADSISGTITTTCYIEQSSSYTSTDWVRVDTLAIADSATPTAGYETGNINGGRLRCICLATGTNVVNVRVAAQLSRRVPQ